MRSTETHGPQHTGPGTPGRRARSNEAWLWFLEALITRGSQRASVAGRPESSILSTVTPLVPRSYGPRVSPTILRRGGFRFYFFSREEPRVHVHVQHAEGEAKFWLVPEVELARNHGLSRRRVTAALFLARRHRDEILAAWEAHFGR